MDLRKLFKLDEIDPAKLGGRITWAKLDQANYIAAIPHAIIEARRLPLPDGCSIPVDDVQSVAFERSEAGRYGAQITTKAGKQILFRFDLPETAEAIASAWMAALAAVWSFEPRNPKGDR